MVGRLLGATGGPDCRYVREAPSGPSYKPWYRQGRLRRGLAPGAVAGMVESSKEGPPI